MRVLVLAPHTDDEITSAGTITRLREKGHEIYLAVFSFCEESSEALGHPRDILEKEFDYSRKVLELDPAHINVYKYTVRHFLQHRQEILEDLVRLRKKIKPRLVFVPNTLDMHQDHQVISVEGRRAFRNCTLLGYESLGALLAQKHLCYVRLNQHHLNTKILCLRCYKSQTVRPDMDVNLKKSLTELRGVQAGVKYAEAFEVIRWIM